MNWIALFWLVSSLVGAAFTIKNLQRSLDRWGALRAIAARESAIIVAFTHVRNNVIFMGMHVSFIVVGLMSLSLHPVHTPEPPTLENLISLVVVMAIPVLLIVLSETADADDYRAMALERASRGTS